MPEICVWLCFGLTVLSALCVAAAATFWYGARHHARVAEVLYRDTATKAQRAENAARRVTSRAGYDPADEPLFDEDDEPPVILPFPRT